jgi:hypothetical protein
MSWRTRGRVSRFFTLKLLVDQKVIGYGNEHDVTLPAWPAACLEMVEPEFILELPVTELNAPPKLGRANDCLHGDVGWQGREPAVRRLLLILGPLDQEPLFRLGPVAAYSAESDQPFRPNVIRESERK